MLACLTVDDESKKNNIHCVLIMFRDETTGIVLLVIRKWRKLVFQSRERERKKAFGSSKLVSENFLHTL